MNKKLKGALGNRTFCADFQVLSLIFSDIDFIYSDHNDDNPDDGFGFDDGVDSDDMYSADEKLSPLQKLEKYMQSENVYTRQMVARGLLDTLRAVEETEEDDAIAVLNAMVKLSEDSDPIVRSELMEQVPHLAVYCQDNVDLYENAVPKYILPMVVRYLNDPNNQVRKTSQAALLVLLEQDLIGKADIEEQVVGVIIDLASPDSIDDYRTEGVALMSKMAPLLGKEMTERLFLQPFCEMCTDPLFHVRKVCAANFGDMCTVVGQQNTEVYLLPKFYYLCEDGVWGVRKACAECFMAVSCSCSLDVRRGELSNLFVNLLCDLSRWVRMAAFQQLGPFISTFADPDLTGLYVNEEGILCFRHPEHLQNIENLEKLRELGEKLENENRLLKELGVTEESEEQNSLDDQAETVSSTEPMDIVIDGSEESREDLQSDDTEVSPEERRAEKYKDTDEGDSQVEGNKDPEVKGINDSPSDNDEESKEENNQDSQVESIDNSLSNCDTKEKEQTESEEVRTDSQSKEESAEEKVAVAESNDNDSKENHSNNQVCDTTSEKDSNRTEEHRENKVHIHLDPSVDSEFSSFNFWRTPLPELDLDFDIVDGKPTNFHITAKVHDQDHHRTYATEVNVSLPASNEGTATSDSLTSSISELSLEGSSNSTVIGSAEKTVEEGGIQIHTASISTVTDEGQETVDNIGSTHVIGHNLTDMSLMDNVQDFSGSSLSYIDSDSYQDMTKEAVDEATLAQQQDIVPQSLLESYLGMVDPSRAQTVDTEITKHCAYNLPAVAYTLGRQNWNCIKVLYETLAADMQWKVRRTLAFSIHEMAIILGEDITHRDLVPVFDGFLKDLDEVRIGVLRHLADFLRLLKPDVRRQYLPKIQGFMNTDNNRNWRFRYELAEQLMLISELYGAKEISQYLLPLGLALCEDRVAEVRDISYCLMSAMIKRLSDDGDVKLISSLLNELVLKFAKCEKWCGRQIYVQLCQAILEEESLPLSQFSSDLMPSLLCLSHDSVPNVRIALAKILAQKVVPNEFFNSEKNAGLEELQRALERLQTDGDRDVRYFSRPHSEVTDIDHKYEEELDEGQDMVCTIK
ncbi:hypothetical protein FSP39_010290 [Pinctada imbricata]|uniref:Serine/threonine-protein phosphatase 4 regulatory subunit 1 n=1 Tax=Pinctada imbricata TaxID=66713 RepID=A0AA89BX68_PINIB|nr:hypothetical protein FSP39_010290 [Pinctada imbricata]